MQRFFACIALLWLPCASAQAEAVRVHINGPLGAGTAGGAPVPSLAQTAMLQAASMVMQQRYAEADALYTQAIAANPNAIDAYLQRSVARREMGNAQGSQADANTAVRLADAQLKANPGNAKLYYQRGTGYRWLKAYPQAQADLERAVQLTRGARWQSDLQALLLEKKMAGVR